MLVTIPSELSRGVVARSVAALRETSNPLLGYVENMKGYWCSGCAEIKPLFPESERVDLGIPCLGQVPFDPQLAADCDRGAGPTDAERPWIPAVRAIAQEVKARLADGVPAEKAE